RAGGRVFLLLSTFSLGYAAVALLQPFKLLRQRDPVGCNFFEKGLCGGLISCLRRTPHGRNCLPAIVGCPRVNENRMMHDAAPMLSFVNTRNRKSALECVPG